jgi:hypothetical protein
MSDVPQLFEAANNRSTALVEVGKTRDMAEVMAQVTLAKRFPRDEQASFQRAMQS